MFTNVFAKVMVAVPHRSGVCPFQINFATSAFLDWIFMLVKGHVLPLFDARVVESVGRMKVSVPPAPRKRREADEGAGGVQQGYESRHVISTVFIHTLMALMRHEDAVVDDNDRSWFIQPAVDATLACRLNPLAMTEVSILHRIPVLPADASPPSRQAVPVAHSLLTRGVHSGMISIVSCLVKALHVPVVPLAHLWRFFTEDQVRAPRPTPRIYGPRPGLCRVIPMDPPVDSDLVICDASDASDANTNEMEDPLAGPEVEDGEVADDKPAPWADQLERAESAPLPPPAVEPAPTMCPEKQVTEVLRLQSARISQLEDVVNRFQMIMDQTMGRLDCEVQRLTSNQTHTTQTVNELRNARDAIFEELGFDKMQDRLRQQRAQAEPPFGGGFRSRGGVRSNFSPGGAYEHAPSEGQWQRQRSYRGKGRN
jgi:hypothetical protein